MDQDAAVSAYSLAMCHAVFHGSAEVADELLKAGADVNLQCADDAYDIYTPIILAVENDDLEVVKVLLKYNPELNDADYNGGRLPLVIAARRGFVDVVRALLAQPDIVANARDSDKDFALKSAAEKGN